MSEAPKPSVSFGFSKKKQPVKLAKQAEVVVEEPDYVKSLQDKQINGTKKEKKAEKKQLVIPLIVKNNWRINNDGKSASDKVPAEVDIDSMAAKEILEEAEKLTQDRDQQGQSKKSNLTIPMFMLNRIPSGFETDEKVDTSLRAPMSTLEDYEAVPVEEYGMAMLHGMGWKAGEGIGLKNKGVAATIDVKLRPKGLGLGADRSVLDAATAVAQNEEAKGQAKLELRNGAYVQVVTGKQQGLYGQIESMDENTARCFVRMALGGNVASIAELCLKPVSAKEYKDSSRILNKDKYEEYRSKQEKARQKEEEEETERRRREKKKERHRHHSRSRSRSRSQDRDRDRDRKSKKSKKNKKKSRRNGSSGGSEDDEEAAGARRHWLHSQLRVRCIDPKLQGGRHYTKKMVVIDVSSRTRCICRAEDGALVDDVDAALLETVVPRADLATVMVVAGPRKGQLCQLLERDKRKQVATVQALPDRDEIYQVKFDDVCEYTGEV